MHRVEWMSANVLQTARVHWRVPVLLKVECKSLLRKNTSKTLVLSILMPIPLFCTFSHLLTPLNLSCIARESCFKQVNKINANSFPVLFTVSTLCQSHFWRSEWYPSLFALYRFVIYQYLIKHLFFECLHLTIPQASKFFLWNCCLLSFPEFYLIMSMYWSCFSL